MQQIYYRATNVEERAIIERGRGRLCKELF